MITIFWEALRESIYRRMSLALLLVGLLIIVLTFTTVSFRTENGQLIAHRGTMSLAAKAFAQDQLQNFLQLSVSLWVFLGISAVAPLLSSYLDKGHIELLLSKGIPRWKIFFGRSAAAFCIFTICIAMINGVPALYFWIRTGYSGAKFMTATLLFFSALPAWWLFWL